MASPGPGSETARDGCSKEDACAGGACGPVQWELQEMQETILELQDEVQQCRAVQLHSDRTIQQLENKVVCLEGQKLELEKQLKTFNRKMREAADEWQRFQADLQTAVVVAEGMKAESQQRVVQLGRELEEERTTSQQLQRELDALHSLR
ncbi:cytospin-B [Leucoraja erinacea]|uniref:cytospin-B n=1 Tax=Leucoraja erinaceus TaxID=7782 RepID=UPI002457131D|nr:cytospin-B [Leucoraja erinacea]